mgnify:CR=1 FL=1
MTQWYYTSTGDLYHHGIKGQKWGIRRFQKNDGSLTPAGKERYYVESDKKEVQNDTKSSTIPKGFKFNRVGQASLDINPSGALYVSSGKADVTRYMRSLGPTPIGKLLGTAASHIQHIEVKENLKKSSIDETTKLTNEWLIKNPKMAESINQSFHALALGKDIDAKFLNDIQKNPDSKDAKRAAYVVSAVLGDPNYKQEAAALYKHFRDNGYDAIPDLNDLYSGTSETATIVINPGKLKVTSTVAITKDLMKEGKKYLKTLGDLPCSKVLEDDED